MRKLHLVRVMSFMSLVGVSAHGLQIKQIIQDERVSATISSQDLNRIEVKGDRITQVFGSSGTFIVDHDRESGHLYIKPTLANAMRPISISITTEKGLVQDLHLFPKAVPSETIFLKVKEKERGNHKNFKEEVIDLMQKVVRGDLPSHYEASFDSNPLYLWKDIKTEIIQSYRGSKYQAEVISFTNDTKSSVILHETQFLCKEHPTLAVGIKQSFLEPGETSYIYRILKIQDLEFPLYGETHV